MEKDKEEVKPKLEKVGAMWINKSEGGNKYATALIDDNKFILFPNNYKTEDKHPDWNIYKDRPIQDGKATK